MTGNLKTGLTTGN